MANTLFLRLEGPMQSWGERARWSLRDTTTEPTKSGVVGLLACALGWSEDEELRRISRQIRMGVRCDRPGVKLVDFHTVVGGVLSAEGKVKKTASTKLSETVVSERTYLSDASFLVAIQSHPDFIDRLSEAVKKPFWPVYLGRKSCPPALPIFAGVGDYASIDQALLDHPMPQMAPVPTWLRVVVESKPNDGAMRQDETNSNRLRTFLPRYTREFIYTPKQAEEEG